MRRADSASTIFVAAGCAADGEFATDGTVVSELQRQSLHQSQIIHLLQVSFSSFLLTTKTLISFLNF
jgi:hypothetical protein